MSMVTRQATSRHQHHHKCCFGADIEYTFTYVIEEAGSFVDTAAYQKLFDGNPNTEAETDLNKPEQILII